MSNLSDIGFPVQNEQDVNEMIMHVLEHVAEIKCPNGTYLKFSDASGAEIYLQGNTGQELIGFNPHFAGKSRRRVCLMKAIARDSSELDGGFQARADPDGEPLADNEDPGENPFVFDVPDFRTIAELEFPAICDIQLTAFASNDLKIYPDKNKFLAAQDSNIQLDSKSFVATGSFPSGDESADAVPPRPFCNLSGEIVEFELMTNQFSGNNFYRFLLETLGGEIDIVADVKLVPDEPNIGGIVSGQFWLSGRLIS